jgi:very-short-patch-repair endonuclease
MGPYVLDFYCPRARLAVEVDGISHDLGDRPARDERRDMWLASRGIATMRIPANEVLSRIEEALEAIFMTAEERIRRTEPPPPSLRDGPPPPQGWGG